MFNSHSIAGLEVEVHIKKLRELEGLLQAENGRFPMVEPHPSTTKIGIISLGQPLERIKSESDVGRDNNSLGEGHVYCIPEIQIDIMDVNKGTTYLAMLTRIGLGSPGNSNDSRGNISQNSPTHDVVDHHFYTPIHKRASKQMVLSQQRLSPKQGGILKNKGKSPQGKR